MDTRKLLYLLRRSTSLKLLIQGKLIHQKILSLGLQENGVFSKNLINLYLSCRQLNSANLVFDAIKDPLDVSLWNSLLAGYTKNSMFVEALELFERLWKHPGVTPDFYTYPSVLKACGGLGRVGLGKMIHTHLVKNGVGFDVVVASSLVGMYGKCGVFMNALQVFDEMSERDVACWNTVISCYYQSGKVKEALDIFEKMRVSGFVPNSMTITTAISACARLFDLQRGEEIYMEFVKEGFVLYDDHVRSALLDLYGKCGCLEMGKVVFKQITRKNLVAWNSMIAGYGLKGDSKSCIELLKRMNNEGTKPSLTTLTSILMACSRSSQVRHGKFIHGYIIRNRVETDTFINISLIDFYFKCGRVQAAVHIFKKTPKMDAISWNVTISGYVTMGNYFEALGIYNDMREAGVRPDAITFSSVLSACSQLAALEKGKEIHSSVIESELENDEVVMGALLDMYAKCGDVNKALQTFYKLPERDAVSWTTMIAAYGSHGQALEALTLFRDMLKSNSKPDRITFLAVLSACSHGGLVDEGSHCFTQMSRDYGIKPGIEHYSCLIDLLGRAGRLEEAYRILSRTPEMREDVGLLSTLFSACQLHRNHELGEKIAGLLIEKDPDEASTHVALSNIYASAKRWDEVRKVRLKMKELGLKKSPGCSWIEIGRRVEPFFTEDKSHAHTQMIYECLTILSSHMEKDELQPF